MQASELTQGLQRLLQAQCTPAAATAIEQGADAAALWQALQDSGYADAAVPEAAGGAGLNLAECGALWLEMGRHALPLPLASTLWIRAEAAHHGAKVPAGPLVLGNDAQLQALPNALHAQAVLVLEEGACVLRAVQRRQTTGVHGSTAANLMAGGDMLACWPARTTPRQAGALITACLMAGALEHVLASTVDYANTRVQFGKPIGRFQAIQQHLSVMAEHTAVARMAAEMACASAQPRPLQVAVAKARCGEAAAQVVALAHAVHGAIGVTAELDLQRHTRALHAWRTDYGGALYWQTLLGQAALADARSAFDFMAQELNPI